MKWLTARMVFGFALMGFAFIALTASPETPRAFSQEEEKDPKRDPKDKLKSGKDDTTDFAGDVGADQCANCHTVGWKRKVDVERKMETFITKEEVNFWEANDIHRYAYDCLSSKLGEQMNAALRPHRGKDYSVKTATECLVCHSADLKFSGEKFTDKELGSKRFYTDYGMSCEVCHGFANKSRVEEKGVNPAGWLNAHAAPSWREKSPELKEKHNLLDMRNPQKRAEKCASCHVGNSAEGKVVTHEIFAAGHPPLQPLEIVTFAANEPAHWFPGRNNLWLRKLASAEHNFDMKKASGSEKTPDAEQKRIAAQNYYYLENESRDVRDLVVGMVATLKSNVNLIREESAAAVQKSEALDFTHFDCYACHHDLQIPAGRQVRGYPWTPGRPTPKPWTNEVLRTLVEVWIKEKNSSVKDRFSPALDAFNKAMTKKPFGLPTDMATATVALNKVLDDLLAEMNVVEVGKPLFDQKYVEASITALRTKLRGRALPPVTYVDYEVAQLYAWTLKVLIGEAKEMGIAVADGDALLTKISNLHKSGEKTADGATPPTLIVDLREKWIPKDKFIPVAERLAPRMNSIKYFDSLGFRKLFD